MKVATIIKNYLPHSHISALGFHRVHMQQDFMNPSDSREEEEEEEQNKKRETKPKHIDVK